MFPTLFWILVAVSAVICLIGFYRFVWFMSVGYGLAVAGCGVTMLVAALVQGKIGAAYLFLCVLLIIYGCRLGLFLLIRELKNASYKKNLESQTKPVPVFVKIVMWILMALLYPCQVSPVLYRLVNGRIDAVGDVWSFIGAAIMVLGIVLEAVADKQKSASKKINPNMVAMDGLFKLCRCPNYFGEMLVWIGVFVSGVNVIAGGQWVIALVGFITILYVMVSVAKRLEKRQNKNYGDKQEYWDYTNSTPILFPFIPLYHLSKKD